VSAYGGVIAARAQAQAEQHTPTAPAATRPAGAPEHRTAQQVELAQLRFSNPDVISVARVTE
jgi:hypothetical protein